MSGSWVFVGIAFFFVFMIAAVIAFKLIKKSVKMAVRMTIVGIIFLIAIIGAAAFFFYGSSESKRSPATQTPRKAQ